MIGARFLSRVFLAAALASLAPAAALAEIEHEIRGDEIIATNLRSSRRRIDAGRAARGAIRKPPAAASADLPAGPPEIEDLVAGSSARYGFDPALIQAVVAAESAFDPMAVSKKGARGLMQLMPDTAQQLGVRNVHDPATNLDAGVSYLRGLVLKYGGNVELALAAYNAGPEAVARHGGVPPYEETRAYIGRIRAFYGGDLQRGDRGAASGGGIRLAAIEPGGVPYFTNLRPRRIVRSAGGATRDGGTSPR